LRYRKEQLLIGKDFDQRSVGELGEIDGAAVAEGGYHLR
jgi:hypothetical protein